MVVDVTVLFGLPLIVIKPALNAPLTPGGNPVTVKLLAPAIEYEIFVIAVCLQSFWAVLAAADESAIVALGLTVIVSRLLVAGLPAVQVALEVRMAFTTSPLVKPEVVNVLLLVPAFMPFTCHW